MASNTSSIVEVTRAMIGGLLAAHDMIAIGETPEAIADFVQKVAVAGAQELGLPRTNQQWEVLTGEAFELIHRAGLLGL